MVTSNKLPEKKFVKMAGQNSVAVVPQRTLLGEVNEHITCPLCRGYYIDATTIVECLHSFCRSCIIKHLQAKSYCPVCEMMINSAKPNIKLDKALQDIVYKLVPGLFQKEMERRQQFYSSRPGPAASATPEQRGEDTERIIFSPEDVISFSLEYADLTDADSISSKSSDSNEPQPALGVARRFLQCPAVVNISHLKKFLSMKFDIDSTQFAIDILYKRVPLPDYYTLMDIAYIYNWKRNEPMRFFYQIIDYIAIRNRIFDINRKGSHFGDRKSSPTSTEDTNVCSPVPNLNDQGSEGSSGAESPMPDETTKRVNEVLKKGDKSVPTNKDSVKDDVHTSKIANASPKKCDEDVEKSQFLNSFELTAKNNCLPVKSSPSKSDNTENNSSTETASKAPIVSPRVEESLKRKHQTSSNTPEFKKFKLELDKTKSTVSTINNVNNSSVQNTLQNVKTSDFSHKGNETESTTKNISLPSTIAATFSSTVPKDNKPQLTSLVKPMTMPDTTGIKRTVPVSQNNISSPKRKPATTDTQPITHQLTSVQKTVSPLKLQVSKIETQTSQTLKTDIQKLPVKKIPDLKPSSLVTQSSQIKGQPVNKLRMDLLANNSDPTIDRSKILSQVKTSLGGSSGTPNSGDPLKSIFDSCNINIPSSLSITLTDQKLDPRNPNELISTDHKKNLVNKNLAGALSASTHKVPSPPVHNYIEILKLPDTDPKKTNKVDSAAVSITSKPDNNTMQPKPVNKSETSAKGPIPNLKPIADTKLGKQSGNFSAPITFQQTFEQQLQSLQTDKKPKLPKTKPQVPKLVPAPNVVSKSVNLNNKPSTASVSTEPKPSSALDLSTPHTSQTPVAPQQTFDKALETMQSIANLAKKQNLPSKGLPLTSMAQSNVFSSMPNRPLASTVTPIRVPTANNNQIKVDKTNSPHANITRQEIGKTNPIKTTGNNSTVVSSTNYSVGILNTPNTTQPSPRQTRSPSSSPKLVIAEEKQATSSLEPIANQTMPMNPSMPSLSSSKNESPKPQAGPSKSGLKPIKPLTPSGKVSGIRPPMTLTPTINTSADYLRPQLISTHNPILRHQMDDWIMSVLQARLPFKSRKKLPVLGKKKKVDIENEDSCPIPPTRSVLKRHLKEDNIDVADACSANKIVKKHEINLKNEDDLGAAKHTNEATKPLTSRENEIDILKTFLIEHLDKEESSSIYISGQPGTGKTASLSYILQLPEIVDGYEQVYINCTMMKSAASIFNRICKDLKLKTTGGTEKSCLTAIEKHLRKKHKMILLVLDEIDQLDSKRQSVLYTIFEWPAIPDSRIVLIGVANALDLTERTLPRLQARCSLRPRNLHFAPYTKEQIIQIFTTVLANEDRSNVFSPVALQMLAAKIAAVSGDMRRALDIGRRVIELARRNKFKENQSVDTMMKDSSVTVELKQVLEVLNNIYGGSRKIENDVDEGFPMQQKLILCSLMLMLTKGKNKDIVMGKLHDVYKKVAISRNIAPLDMSEMAGACSLLESSGALRVGGGAARARRLRLQWDEAELAAALRDKPLLAAILAGNVGL
ncbi:polycomb group protein Psc-like [Ostrinia nubilalis]|uniref:polycomb group protein Psc-like n=1 Tax=Ostrinia nubilalis TaxID=29057 RepID=UPI0030822081